MLPSDSGVAPRKPTTFVAREVHQCISCGGKSTLQSADSENQHSAFEKHYRVKELATLWGLSTKTITRLFADEPGVLSVSGMFTGKRKYVTLSIPQSVALRIHERLRNQTLQPTLAGGNPLRVIHLRHLDAGMSKKPRNVIKLKAA